MSQWLFWKSTIIYKNSTMNYEIEYIWLLLNICKLFKILISINTADWNIFFCTVIFLKKTVLSVKNLKIINLLYNLSDLQENFFSSPIFFFCNFTKFWFWSFLAFKPWTAHEKFLCKIFSKFSFLSEYTY